MRLIFRVAILFLLVTILFSESIGSIYAEEVKQLELPKTAVNPGSFYYSFKRLWEKGIEKLQFSKQSKINFYQSQLKTRLAELNYVVENKLLSEVQTSSERFAYYAGILTEELVKQNERSSSSNKDKERFVKEFDQFSKFLENLRDKYPANSAYWMLIQHDINSLSILAERLK